MTGPGAGAPPSLRVDWPRAGAAVLTIDRPAVHNALDWATMAAFAEAVEQLHARAADPSGDLRVVIVAGAGEAAFCSGGDQQALHTHLAQGDGVRLAGIMGDALVRLERLPVPVVAAVNGFALGGGSEIALACDVRVVDEAVRFGLVHLRLGLIPGWGGGQRLQRLVGYGRAIEMMLSARAYGAPELLGLGLAAEIAPRGQALSAALAWADRLAAADPGTVQAVKRLLQAGWDLPYDDALAAERSLFPDLWAADAHVAAVRAFVGGARVR